MTNYLDSSAIGSSLLADCIESLDPLVVCTDRATVEKEPTSSMEPGKIFEDLAEAAYGRDMDWFWDKYFKSDLASIPVYRGERKDTKQILEILDEMEEAANFSGNIINEAYIWNTKPDKKTKKIELNSTFKSRHRILDQIRAHEYRRPITKSDWENVQAMFDRFKNHPFTLKKMEGTFHEWMTESAEVIFQVPFFWESDGAKCRAKWDMIWLIDLDEEKPLAVPFDLKKTANTHKFRQFWRSKYIWQSKHYMEGFKLWCEENGYEAHDRMYYAAYEAEKPYLAYLRYLHPDRLEVLDTPYRQALMIIQAWIEAGRPTNGYLEQQALDEWGKIYD